MPLEEYRRKRDFKKTPEPPPGPVKVRKRQLSYLIQKHDATRLHYDFRLELDGVLLSWAVTKGPSLNPADKRLAVRTEDHPLSYGSFEGTIPEGEYGGGTVMLWDRGTWEPKADPHLGLRKGHLSFVLHGERLAGAWDLIRMRGDGKRENWLLIKEDDDKAARAKDPLEKFSSSVKTGRSMAQIAGGRPSTKAAVAAKKRKASPKNSESLERLMSQYPEAQLATLVDEPPQGSDWLHEIKLDGYRLLGYVSGGVARLRTRNGKDWTARFPSITESLEALKVKTAVVDMEAVVLDTEGKSSFQALQATLGVGGDPQQIVGYVFDLLYWNNHDLSRSPLLTRKEQLRDLFKASSGGALVYSDHVLGQGAKMFAKACEAGLEGIVSKRTGDPYVPGRQKSWLKTKCGQRQEFVILGYSDPRSGERALGALYLGYYKDGKLRYAGKVGTGFSMQSARELTARFAKLKVPEPILTRALTVDLTAREWQSIHWVKPVLLCEVAFTEWTKDGRIRHPSFQGLREDKNAGEAQKEIAVPKVLATRSALDELGISITHPDRVISKIGDITKGQLADYYASIAPFILPSITRRPLSLLRCPSGINKDCFYQRNPGRGLGTHVHPFEFVNKGKRYQYLYIEDAQGLLEIVQMGGIEIHPWGAMIDTIDYPDRLVFDLDPAPDIPFEALKIAAKDLRKRLKTKGLESALKCTGGKGLHVTVPLAAKDKWPVVKSFAAGVAEEMVSAAPEAYVATMSKAKRAGKIFIDYFRNDYTATAIADYAVRARPGAPVAAPIDWRELTSLESADQFTIAGVLKRLKNKKPDAVQGPPPQRIPEGGR